MSLRNSVRGILTSAQLALVFVNQLVFELVVEDYPGSALGVESTDGVAHSAVFDYSVPVT